MASCFEMDISLSADCQPFKQDGKPFKLRLQYLFKIAHLTLKLKLELFVQTH